MVEIPNTVFGLMSLIIVTLAGVVTKLFLLLLKSYEDNKTLQDLRLKDAQFATNRYDKVMGKFSQSFNLFAAKVKQGDDHVSKS